MKVFWSWQSDTPGKTGRHFVKGALQKALEQLKQDPELDEPLARYEQELHLDHDIQGVPGSPNLFDTIQEKIDLAGAFVADVTSVGQVSASDQILTPKKLINANVAIELGYALKVLTSERVLLVFNEHYGSFDDLPFDLRHKGGSLTFQLAPDADRSAIAAAERQLIGLLASKLKLILRDAADASREPFVQTPSTYCPAAYFPEHEVLAEGNEDEDLQYAYDRKNLLYLRLVPAKALERQISATDLLQKGMKATTLEAVEQYDNQFAIRNRYGAFRWIPGSRPARGRAKIRSSTQVFANGEIWTIGTTPIQVTPPPGFSPSIKLPFIHAEGLETACRRTASSLMAFSSDLLGVSGPWRLICGMSGIAGAHLFVPHAYISGARDQIGPFYESNLETTSSVTVGDDSLDIALLAFFTKVWDLAGGSRPAMFNGF